MNIQIRAYDLGPNFKSKEYDKSRRAGFFVTKIGKKSMSSEVTNYITKWDLNSDKGPIRVRISAAVPEEYTQSVVEAVEYWNIVLGKKALVAETGVDPQATPEDRSIMVRWITWMDAGAAYAMSQSDPLTGEILRGQVFMPAVFTKVGSLNQLILNNKSPVAPAAIGAIACDFSETLKGLANLSREADGSQRLRLAKDSIRSTVAHELGHTLGLRHNFAGSFSAKVSTKEIYAAAKTYLKDEKAPGLETSTSIMDYVSGIDDVLMSAKIKNSALSYDKMALTWAYSDSDSALDEKTSGYCTDEDIALANKVNMAVYGCERFDEGNNPLERKYLDIRDDKDNFINTLWVAIIGRMYPADQPDQKVSVDQVLKDVTKYGKMDGTDFDFISGVLFDKVKDGAPNEGFTSLEYIKAGRIAESYMGMDSALQERRVKDLTAAGGYATILNGLLRDESGKINFDWYLKQIIILTQQDFFKKGTTLGGRTYELTDDEQTKIAKYFVSFNDANRKLLVQKTLATLIPYVNKETEDDDGKKIKVSAILGDSLLTDSQAADLEKLYIDLSVASSSKPITVKVGYGLTQSIDLPNRLLPASMRVDLANLLSSQALSFNQQANKALAIREMINEVNRLVLAADPSVKVETLNADKLKSLSDDLLGKNLINQDAADWLSDEITALFALGTIN
jgi:hypothetical protein